MARGRPVTPIYHTLDIECGSVPRGRSWAPLGRRGGRVDGLLACAKRRRSRARVRARKIRTRAAFHPQAAAPPARALSPRRAGPLPSTQVGRQGCWSRQFRAWRSGGRQRQRRRNKRCLRPGGGAVAPAAWNAAARLRGVAARAAGRYVREALPRNAGARMQSSPPRRAALGVEAAVAEAHGRASACAPGGRRARMVAAIERSAPGAFYSTPVRRAPRPCTVRCCACVVGALASWGFGEALEGGGADVNASAAE